MTKNINIQNKKEALFELQRLKEKQYEYDVKFTNVHLREINALVNMNLFSKNDLFVESNTLWDLMQPLGNSRKHHFHELSPEDILESLNSITTPYCVLKNDKGRIEIISSIQSHFGVQTIVVIELNSGLVVNSNANVNKMVTMIPKRNAEKYIKKFPIKQILYISKGNLK